MARRLGIGQRWLLGQRSIVTIAATIVVSLAGAYPAQAATEAVSFYYDQDWGGNIDTRCGTPQKTFRVVIVEHADFTGRKARVCSYVDNFSNVPFNPDGTGNWHDKTSSMNIIELPSNGCLRFYWEPKGQGDTPRHDYRNDGKQVVQEGGNDQYSRVHAC